MRKVSKYLFYRNLSVCLVIAQSDALSLVMLSARCFSTVIPILPLATGFDQYFNFAMLRYLAEERLALTSGA